MTAHKLSVSVPGDLLDRLEKHRKRRGWSRSEAVQVAIREWLRSLETDQAIAGYVAGYQRLPEDAEEGQALLEAQMDGLEPGAWA